ELSNLLFREVMLLDNFTNHQYGASAVYSYNSRLHIADIKTTFFKGFSPKFFQWNSPYNGVESPTGGTQSRFWIEVELQTGAITQKVYADIDFVVRQKMFFSALLSYPDIRAKRMTVYEHSSIGTWKKLKSLELLSHDFLNIAYYLNEDTNPIMEDASEQYLIPPPTNIPVTLAEQNKIKISELNNPVLFPVLNTYQIGSGNILNIASNIMNVSDRNFGQYPLYIFTTQGIWTLSVGTGEVVYSTLSAPTYYDTPTSPVVCSTPFGVVFTTRRGLCIINGMQVDFISPQIEQPSIPYNIDFPPQAAAAIHRFNVIPFPEYLKNIELILYNSGENEIIVCDKESPYNYVFNIPSQACYLSTEVIEAEVKNVFLRLLVLEGLAVKDYAQSGQTSAKASFITRPLLWGTPDIKKLERIMLRATLHNLTGTSAVMIHPRPRRRKFQPHARHYSSTRKLQRCRYGAAWWNQIPAISLFLRSHYGRNHPHQLPRSGSK
ncbi:hypothetical protein EZS27_034808, partial [termite gut metagenome]